ncbi:MAG: hypothetical protein Q9159_006251 [Coniocarpon cinnabarinum]
MEKSSYLTSPAETSYHHATWARTFHSRPELFIQPEAIEQVQETLRLAQRERARIVVTGASHSPSDLTCTSSWLVSLKNLAKILDVNKSEKTGEARVTVQAGLSLHDLSESLVESHGLIIPNLGSIDVQSVAGAIATGTHGSSLYHGILAQNVYSLKLCLADGSLVKCSPTERPDLFRAALVSLGALGIIVEVEIRMVPTCNVEWSQDLAHVHDVLSNWDSGHWTQAEFVRCWWLPYQRNMTVWTGNKTTKPKRAPKPGFLTKVFGPMFYEYSLWFAQRHPWLLPLVERFMFGVNNGRLSPGHVFSGVDEQRSALLMDCGFSQLVNEWGIPLHKGPEAIRRLEAWLLNDQKASGIPYDSSGVYVHFPIEVRVTDNSASRTPTRGFLDPTVEDGPTLYFNATLYRPFGEEPTCFKRYYEAFEWLMKDLGGKPHWAKNFQTLSTKDIEAMYGDNLKKWREVRQSVDPEGAFVGPWHRRTVLAGDTPTLAREERYVGRRPQEGGGFFWEGKLESKAG